VTHSDDRAVVDYPFPPVDAIEPPAEWEQLRQQCPVAHVRLPSGDQASLPDGVLPAGTTAVCSMGSANRDENVFAGAAGMDLTRSPNLHLSFGAGPHSCIGQPLARAELQVVLEVLPRRLPTLELAIAAEDLRPVEGLAVGGLREVPVRW